MNKTMQPSPALHKKPDAADLRKSFLRHLQYTLVKDKYSATRADLYLALSYAVRDLLAERWLDTQQSYYINDAKRVYYISMEFLIGRTLGNSLINLGIEDEWETALTEMGFSTHDLAEEEWDAGLGNGGLGRLAACFLDSMATMALPAYGYGIRYEYGMFYQRIVDGCQVEVSDNWLRYGNPWEFGRQEHLTRSATRGAWLNTAGELGEKCYSWIDTHDIMALAYDVPMPGYGNDTVNTLRLWSAKSSRDFELASFNRGNYIRRRGIQDDQMKIFPRSSIRPTICRRERSCACGRNIFLHRPRCRTSSTAFPRSMMISAFCPKRSLSSSTTPTLPWQYRN